MKICVSFFKSMYSTSSEPRYFYWPELASFLTNVVPTTKAKKSLPCMVFGRIPEGASRRNDNVETVDALVLDIERKTTGYLSEKTNYSRRLDSALLALDPYDYALYTTHSHLPSDPRVRVVVPLRTAIDVTDYKAAMSCLNNLTGGIADRNAQRLSQAVYQPFCPYGEAQEYAAGHINVGKRYDFHAPLAQEIAEVRSILGEGVGRLPHDTDKRVACKNVTYGVPYAKDGNRDNMALAITWHLARAFGSTELSREAFDAVFRWSVETMESDAPSLDNLWDKYIRGVERVQNDLPEVVEIAKEAVPDHPICVFKNSYYVLDDDIGYTRPLHREEAGMAISQKLEGKIPLEYVTPSGDVKPISLGKIFKTYGTILEDTAVSLTAEKSYLKDGILYEAALKWPTVTPVFDPQIDEWLNLLGGDRSEKLKDWLSIYSDLDRLLSCLIIMGEPGAGKTLLAMGLASRFGAHSPATQKTFTGNFQGELAKCPLVHIDEEIVDSGFGRTFLAAIRSELSIRERFINRKYGAPTTLKGAIRCVITANHLPFKQRDASTRQDLEAIAQRFHWVKATKEARSFLESIPPETKQLWRKSGIANHIKFLEDTREISHEHRFGVPGESEQLADLINISVEWNAWVTEWICSGVMDSFKRLNTNHEFKHGAFIKDGKIYVRANILVRTWETYLPDMGVKPNTRPITDALKGVSVGTRRPGAIGVDLNNQFQFYEIRPSPLITWLEETGTGTAAAFKEKLSHDTKFAAGQTAKILSLK